MNCPKCGCRLISVSALTHGCENCQRLYLMINGKLQDQGDWPVAETMSGKLKRIAAALILISVGLVFLYGLWLYAVGMGLL